MAEIRFVTLNPGHFHAALVQKEMYPQVAPQVHVYAPLGADLVLHLQRIAGFNTRSHEPTHWELEVHAGADPLGRLVRERPGNVVVLAGRNAAKIDAIESALGAGLHVLADKPWIIVPEALPRLQAALDSAARQGLIAYDIMTERYEITSLLQRELIRDEALFGTMLPGTPEEPGVHMESVHYLKKLVAGVPLRRPAWFFDIAQQGEGLADVGTHLVDLVMWLLFPGEPIATSDIAIVGARRWPTVLTRADLQQSTGELDFPRELPFYCNTQVSYTVRGIQVRLGIHWDIEAPAGGGDTHLAVLRGSAARVEIHQGRAEQYRPELYVYPTDALGLPRLRRALEQRLAELQPRYPGLGLVDRETHYHVTIPAGLRVGHEAHFAAVTQQFLRYVQGAEPLPAWENANLLAKYLVTTRGVARSRQPTA